jgi:disulfide bond formation protein DsbB
MLSSRSIFFMGFLSCALMLGIAGYFQFVDHLDPCPLCILQRVFTLFVGIILLLAAVHNAKGWGRKVYGSLAGLFALVGAGISMRHVWLQNLPEDQVPSCGPGLNFMLENFPLSDAINMVMRGSGECAEIAWSLMGLSIPAWTLLAFIALAFLSISQALRK